MKVKITLFVSFLLYLTASSQSVRYSPAWFGPNANPVAEITDARIPKLTTFSLMTDNYFGFGDYTRNGYFKIEIPLVPERVSFKIWSTILENYTVSDEIIESRNMLSEESSGKANGDIYVQTRISLLSEKKYAPAVIINSTLKTASGTNFQNRRYFNTPGYYFDLESAKSFTLNNKYLDEIRLVGNLGFLCWETTNSTQNDAIMYGLKIIASNKLLQWENSLAGYDGWMYRHPNYGTDYGDSPLVYNSKFVFKFKNTDYFTQYQWGIRDFPYHQLRVGFTLKLAKLTPDFYKKND